MMVENKGNPGKNLTQRIGLILGPILFFFVIIFFDLEPGKPIVTRMAAVALLMALWWITDAIPLFATALLPMVLYPLFGILTAKVTAPVYVNSTIFLFIGGFMIALTMEDWNLHKRIALFIIRIIGGGPSRIVLGFMVAAAFLSMWISNTATAIMMVPIGLAIVSQMEAKFSLGETRQFTLCLMLGIAYACSVGGIATLVGTPPNLAFVRIFEITFPEAKPIAFGAWFIMGLPLSAIMLGVIWLLLTKVLYRGKAHITVDKSIVDKEYKELGSMSFEERTVLAIFFLTAILWIFRNKLNLGFLTIPGWSQWIPYPKMIDDGTVALFMAMLMFVIPSRSRGAKSATIMGPEVIKNIPWNIVVLFGGGFALAQGFQVTGLSALIGQKFAGLAGMHPIVIVFVVCIGLTFLTEVTSNTATTQMILPILAALALDMKINPLFLMIPATLSASCAFMLPVATPPNAIVFGSGRIKIADMARAGIFINIICAFIITLFFYFIATAIFSIDASVIPEWAQRMGSMTK